MKSINLSASALNTYLKSPLEYYYKYILNAEKDTEVPQVYGDAGTLVHELIEHRVSDKDTFSDEWVRLKLDKIPGLFNRFLNPRIYYECVVKGLEVKNNVYTLADEEGFDSEFMKVGDVQINLKGFIDLQCLTVDGRYQIMDWKTCSKKDTSGSHKRQALMYAYLVWNQRGVLPERVRFVYLKLEEKDMFEDFVFTLEDIKEFKQLLRSTGEYIAQNIDNIDAFVPGNYNHIFNSHLEKCKVRSEGLN